jgi:hypothetical protein
VKGNTVAKDVVVRLVDDLDGSDAEETVRFGLDGKQYEIDLSGKNAERLRKSLERYVEKARSASDGRGRGGGRKRAAQAPSREFDPAEVRRWAKSKRMKVSDRGRIPADVVEKFQAARGR